MTSEPVGGPWVQAALFCEKVLIEQDSVPSFIRVIDQVRHPVVLSGSDGEPPPLPYQLTGFVALKPGSARGRIEYTIVMETPAGLRRSVFGGSFSFAGGPNNGVNIPFQFMVLFESEGLYWFDLILGDGQVLTRMPFYVEYQIMRPGAGA